MSYRGRGQSHSCRLLAQPLPSTTWENFKEANGGERVAAGENIALWETDDPSVFYGTGPLGYPLFATVSALQLYLDLHASDHSAAGVAVYEQELAWRFGAARCQPKRLAFRARLD